MFRGFFNANRKVSRYIDSFLGREWRVSGGVDFQKSIVPSVIRNGIKVYDIGGGSRPFFSPQEKAAKQIEVVGLDVSEDELTAAPAGSYDGIIVADLTTYTGVEEADAVICQATLEHVDDTEGAILAIESILKPGGTAAIFVPCRNALFARLNLLLPQGLKYRLLTSLYPSKAHGHDGFVAYYDRCLPSEISSLGKCLGMEVKMVRPYWMSSYCFVFVPAYIVWRLWTIFARYALGEDYCETFSIVLQKSK